MISHPEELRSNIIKSASRVFYKNEFHTISIKDICIASGYSKSEIENVFPDTINIYVEILNLGLKNYFNHPIFNETNDSDFSIKSKIDDFIEHQMFHMQEKEDLCTKIFARELLLPSNRLTPFINKIISQKMRAALTTLGIYTNLDRDDPLLLMAFTQCFSPGLRLIALTNSEYPLLKPLLSLPQNELNAYLKTFIFSGLDGIKSINLALEIT